MSDDGPIGERSIAKRPMVGDNRSHRVVGSGRVERDGLFDVGRIGRHRERAEGGACDGDVVDGDARESRVVLHGEVHRERTKAPECVPGPSVRTRVVGPVSEIPRIRRDVAVRVGRGPSVEEDVPTGDRILRLEIKRSDRWGSKWCGW